MARFLNRVSTNINNRRVDKMANTNGDCQHPSFFQFSSTPKETVFYRDIYCVLLENGERYIWKPERPEDPVEDRDEYLPQSELEEYEKYKHLQGKYIPICYGLMEIYYRVGLVVKDCGSKTFEHPPNNENSKFILYMRAMWAAERCLASGLVHQNPEFRNYVYRHCKSELSTLRPWIPHVTSHLISGWTWMEALIKNLVGKEIIVASGGD